MSQNPVGIRNNYRSRRIETGQRSLVTIPIPQSQHGKMQPGEGIRVNFLLVWVRREPARVKRRCGPQTLDGLIHLGGVDRRSRWRGRRAVSAIIQVGNSENIRPAREPPEDPKGGDHSDDQ